MIKRKFNEWKKKKIAAKISDIVFVILIVAVLIPSSRGKIIGFVNTIKAKVIQPSLKKESKQVKLSANDFDWEIISLNEGRTNLRKYKGKVIFINFWATWCPPCVAELPEIQALYNKFRDNSDIVFILVSNENPQVIESFLDQKKYDFPVFVTMEQSPEVLFSRTIPTSFLISKEGKIVIKQKGVVKWSGDKMEKIINNQLEK